MQVTEVLVAMSSSMYYGEDMREIDKLERALRKQPKVADNARITFLIADNIPLDVLGNTKAIAFCIDRKEEMCEACKKGMTVFRYNYRTYDFEEVVVEKIQGGYRIHKI